MEHLLLQIEILWPALLAGLLVLATHVPLGREILLRGIIFVDLAITQIAAFGVVVANVFWLGDSHAHIPQTLIAVTAALLASIGLYHFRELEVRYQEALIGVLFVLAATGSVLVLAADPHGGEQLKAILVGQILWTRPAELIPLAVAYAAVLAIWFRLRVKLGAWLFFPLFAVTVTLSTQVAGVFLVFASLIIPSLATLHHANPLARAFGLGAIGYGSGLLISALLDLPAGAAIVWCLALVALVYYGVRALRRKGRVSNGPQYRQRARW